MKLVKQIGFKLIVTMCIVMTFCGFIASTPVEASKVSTEFYYSGTTKGSYTVEKGFLEKLVNVFDALLDYMLGLITMGFRIVLVGWTALMERCLTWILEGATGENVEIDKMSTTNITGSDDYVTLDAIFFNRVPLLDINIFNFEERDDVTATGMPKEEEETKQGETEKHDASRIIYTDDKDNVVQGEKRDYQLVGPGEGTRPELDNTPNHYAPGQQLQQQQQQEAEQEGNTDNEETGNEKSETKTETEEEKESLVMILKKAIAGWYYTFRLISIMVMLVLLVYIGIKLAIQSSTTEKALYKRVLFDWVVGMILVFSIHYIMIFIIQFNEILVDQIRDLREGATGLKVYEYGLIERAEKPVENDELEMTLYEEVKTRAYDAKLTVGTTGMIMYMVLVFYAWKYTFIYLKRYLTVAVLVIIAPLVAVSYAFNKVNTGKTKIFSDWLKEFFFIVILQSIHALMYVVFVDTALAISLNSISGVLLVFILLNFMCKAEDIFRKIFNVQGNLDVEKGGLKEALQGLKGGMVAMGAGKVAAKFTKGVAKASVKPFTTAGGYGFGKIMEHRANSDKFNKKKEQDEMKSAERLNKIEKGSIALALKSGEIDVAKLTETVKSLKDKKGQVIHNEDGEAILVDDEYIAKEEEALNKINEIANANPEDMIKDFNAMTTKWALTKQYVKGKWKDIMNPYHYVEKGEDGKYHAIKTKREFNSIGRKTDSVGKRLAERLNVDNLLGLDKNTKEALGQQADLLKSQMIGFAGILIGLPAMVANPAVGATFLYQGVKHSNEAYGYRGKNKNKELKKVKLMPDGKYTLVGFEGHSKQEMANEAKRQARMQAEEIYSDRAMQDQKMVNKVKKSHPKLYASLKGLAVAGVVAGAAGAAVGTGVTFAAVHPVTLPIAGMIIPVTNAGSNAWSRLHETQRAANRANSKLYEKQVKSNDATLSYMADKYFEFEADQYKEAANSHGKEFAAAYWAIKDADSKAIDEMSDSEVKREFGYEDIEIETKADGRKQLSGSSENSIIDNAIIETAQKYGIMDIGEFDLSSSHMTQVSKEIETKLRKLGLIGKGISISDIIQDLDKKIKDRQAILAKGGTRPVEEKMAEQAIIEVMQEENTANPNKVNEDSVMDRLTKKYQDSIPGAKPTEETNSTVSNMQAQKGENGSSRNNETKIQTIIDEATIRKTIQARKSILSDRARKPVSTENSQQMREALKRKKSAELDAKVLEQQDKLDNGAIASVSEQIINENGGVNSNKDGSMEVGQSSDKVLEMLNLQTKMHQDKLNLEKVGGNSKDEKLKAYKRQLFDSDGSIRLDVWQGRDGSKKVVEQQTKSPEVKSNNINYATTRIEDVLIRLNNK